MQPYFTPQLFIPKGTFDVSFYINAFGAALKQKWTNEDGSIHVAAFTIGELIFYLHEDNKPAEVCNPQRLNGTTVIIGLVVSDPDELAERAIAAGAVIIEPLQNFDYGLRQGKIKDPFGHVWMIQGAI